MISSSTAAESTLMFSQRKASRDHANATVSASSDGRFSLREGQGFPDGLAMSDTGQLAIHNRVIKQWNRNGHGLWCSHELADLTSY